ncbi:hypothetical protein F9K33_16550 [bacterium]|nr:MAG: hypothetical protein F9K33_16550 [bacterium]
MSGEPHIITVQANSNGQTEVLMASEKPLPLETKFREAHDTLILMRHYGQTIKDPKLKQDFDRLFSDKLDRLPGDLVDQFHSLRKQYYPEKKRIIDEDSAKETVKNLKNQANKLANAIKKWGDANNIKDFSAMEIDREVNDRMYSLRKKAWIKTKEDVQQILSYYNFRGKPILFRGSLYEGKRGEHKAYVLFDDKHFDVDMYVVDPVAYREAQEKGMPPIAGKIFPDKRFPELDALSRSVALDLAAKFPEVHKLQKVGVVIVPKDQET